MFFFFSLVSFWGLFVYLKFVLIVGGFFDIFTFELPYLESF